MPSTTISPHPELAGQLAVVTGATAGIGFQTARLLARRGASVLLTGRDPQRGANAVAAIRGEAKHDRVDFLPVDHSTVGANERLAIQIKSRFDHLDVLVNNVGGVFPKRLLTPDGYELTLALNFLAPFVLTEALQPLLTAASVPARCVNVVSSSFNMTKGDPFDDLQTATGYIGIYVHARAKLLTLLWTKGISHQIDGGDLVVTAVNPGMAWTPMTQSLTPESVPAWRYIFPVVRFFQRRAKAERAATRCESIVLAEQSGVAGRYFDGAKERPLPQRFADPTLPARVQAIGADLRTSAPTAGALS